MGLRYAAGSYTIHKACSIHYLIAYPPHAYGVSPAYHRDRSDSFQEQYIFSSYEICLYQVDEALQNLYNYIVQYLLIVTDFPGAICRTVIHQNYLNICIGLTEHTFNGIHKVRFYIEYRNYYTCHFHLIPLSEALSPDLL